jgi:hypothetical protein
VVYGAPVHRHEEYLASQERGVDETQQDILNGSESGFEMFQRDLNNFELMQNLSSISAHAGTSSNLASQRSGQRQPSEIISNLQEAHHLLSNTDWLYSDEIANARELLKKLSNELDRISILSEF